MAQTQAGFLFCALCAPFNAIPRWRLSFVNKASLRHLRRTTFMGWSPYPFNCCAIKVGCLFSLCNGGLLCLRKRKSRGQVGYFFLFLCSFFSLTLGECLPAFIIIVSSLPHCLKVTPQCGFSHQYSPLFLSHTEWGCCSSSSCVICACIFNT